MLQIETEHLHSHSQVTSFEFRMVGSSDSIAPANVVLNTIVAESFKEIADELEGSEDMQMAVHDMIKKLFTDHHRVVFNGNG